MKDPSTTRNGGQVTLSATLSTSGLKVGVWLLVIVLGFVQAWSTRYFIDPDGISYLDIADKYLHGDWNGAVNTYFSPLYSWLFAAALYLLRPSSYWEYPVVHLVNFLIYLSA